MDRRGFLKDAGGLLGLALGGPLSGCATHKGVVHELETVDAEGWLRGLERQERAIRGIGFDPAVGRAALSVGLPADYAADALFQVLVLSSFRDLPAEAQSHPAVQQRAWRAAVRNGQLALATARTLGEIPDSKQEWLREEDSLASLKSGLVNGWRGMGVEQARRDQLVDGVEQLQWRFSRLGPELVFADQLRRTRKLGRSAGLAPADWDGAIELPVPVERMAYPDHPSLWKQMHTSERLAMVGATICGLGVGLFAGGLIVLNAGVFYGVFGLTFGVIGVIGGLVVLLVAGGKSSRERRNPAAHVTRGVK